MTLPDLSVLPFAREHNAVEPLALLSVEHNKGLARLVNYFRESVSAKAQYILFDADRVIKHVVFNREFYGLKKLEERCYQGWYTGGNTSCLSPEAFVFFDGLHPTTKIHCWVSWFFQMTLFESGYTSREPVAKKKHREFCLEKDPLVFDL